MRTTELETAVEAIVERAGEHIACGTPLGIGKPVPLLNALYARVKTQARLRLSVTTGLTLELPRAAGEARPAAVVSARHRLRPRRAAPRRRASVAEKGVFDFRNDGMGLAKPRGSM